MTSAEFNTLAERANRTCLVADFDALMQAIRSLRVKTIVGVVDRDRVIDAELVGIEGERVIVRDTAYAHRLRFGAAAAQTDRRTLDISPYDVRAVSGTKFGRGRRKRL